MKKYFMIFAASLTVFAACQEEMAPEINTEVTPEINTNEDGILNYPIDITFVASNEAGTKTVINGEFITWESDDEIKVLWSNTGSNKAIASPYNENSCAQFTTKVEEADAYYAVHPYATTSSYVDGNIVVKVPSVQGGVFENANIAVAKANEDNVFLFRHLVGMIEFTTDTPGKVTISGAEDDILTGTVSVTGFDENGYPQYSEDKVTDSSSVIEIDVKSAGTYYAAFLPSATLKCLSVKVEGSESTEYALSANQLQMARGKVIELGNIDTKFGKHLFVSASADGNGDGKTWETALTFDQMAKMLSANRNGALSAEIPSDDVYKETHKIVHAAEIHGKTFHIAAGEYQTANYIRMKFDQNETPVKVTLKGGYDPNSKGTDLSRRNVATYVTKVKGAAGAEGGSATKRVFLINHKVDLTLDGMSLTDGFGDSTFGGGSVFMDQASSNLTCVNCTISNNTSPINSGAIYATAGTLVFKGCTFSKNTGTEGNSFGGAIYAKNASLTCTGCTFSENSSVNNGGAVWLNAMSKADFTDCDFISNVCTKNLAGAICLSGANPLTITGGTFKGNSAPNGGCFYNNATSTINITGVKFTDNVATTGVGGVFYNNTSGHVINIKDSEFNSNTAATEGGAIFFKNGKWTVSNTTFKNNTAISNGGAIYAHTGSITIQDGSYFEANETTAGSVGGGAVYVTTNAIISVTGSTFRSNMANGSYKDANNADVHRKGGAIAIANSAGAAHVINSTSFVSNQSGWGGGVFVSEKQLDVADCNFDKNTSSNRGGALYGEGANLLLRINKTHFSANASVQGAAIRTTNGQLYMNACTVTDNKPSNNNTGGVLYLGKTSFINNCCFYDNDNTAAQWVSDIVLNTSATTILNSTVVEKASNVTGIRTYNTSATAPTNLYNNTILCGHDNVGVGWGDGSWGAVISGGYNYTGPWVVKYTGSKEGAVATTIATDKTVTPSSVFDNFTLTNNVDGRNWYTWSKPEDVAGTTAANVTTFLNGITGGSDFAAWLGTVDGLTKDIAGNSRPETGWYPGCYQGN